MTKIEVYLLFFLIPDISWEASADLARHAGTDMKDPSVGIFNEAAVFMDSGASKWFYILYLIQLCDCE